MSNRVLVALDVALFAGAALFVLLTNRKKQVPKQDLCVDCSGTVDPYSKHVVVCCGKGAEHKWGEDIAESIPFLKALKKQIKMSKIDGVRITACDDDGCDPQSDKQDVLIFPDMIRIQAVSSSDIDSFCRQYLMGGETPITPAAFKTERITGRYVLVCCHGAKDQRCGTKGPQVASLLSKMLDLSVNSVQRCSHVGGHKYAGNVIVYPQADWYGLISDANVEEFYRVVFRDERVFWQGWRGRLGLESAEQKRLREKNVEW